MIPEEEYEHCEYGDLRLPHYCCNPNGDKVGGPYKNPMDAGSSKFMLKGDDCVGTKFEADPPVKLGPGLFSGEMRTNFKACY